MENTRHTTANIVGKVIFWMGMAVVLFYVFVFGGTTIGIIKNGTQAISSTEKALMGGSTLTGVLNAQAKSGNGVYLP